jgi:tetratricopeptide (TPR) repeat protein
MDYVANRLRRSGLNVLPSDQALHLSTLLEDPNVISPAALRKLQSASGARWIVAPDASRDRQGWRMRLVLREGDRQQVIEGHGTTTLAAAAAVSDSWLRRLGRSGANGEAMPSPLTERVQQVDAEILAGKLAVARRLIDGAPPAERDDPRLRVRAGQLEYRAGRIEEAAVIFQQVLDRQPAVADEVRAKALMGQGAVEIRRGNFPAAEARYTQALTVLEAGSGSADEPAAIGNAYNGRGVARVQQGKMEAAVQDMGLARIAMQRSGSLIEAATVGSNLGQIETSRGHYAQALQEFDKAIAVFERFDVHDYLAVTLMSKAATQLKLVQPADAATSIRRAEALVKSLEDPELATRIDMLRIRILLANGRLREAERSIAARRALGPEHRQELQELTLRLQLARNARAEAGALARRRPDAGAAVPGSLALVAVQAALGNHDTDSARYWLSRAPGSAAGLRQSAPEWDAARALLAGSEPREGNALQIARRAMAQAERTGSPDERVQTGLVQARLLLDKGQREAAAAVLGDLDAFAATDYRVAWATLALYRALGDPAMTAIALVRVQALRGERDIAVEPVL